MATTTNYGWTTPDDTALVKDGAAAIRTLGSSVDTTTKALNPSTTLGDIEYRSSTANTNTRLAIGTSGQGLQVVAGVPSWAATATSTLTTTGDLLYASAANTLARRAIGTTGQVLTVSGGVPTWSTATSAGANWSLLNAGGTALTGADTITVSGISGKDKIMVLIENASSANASSLVKVQLNTDTGANYYSYGQLAIWSNAYDMADFGGTATPGGSNDVNIFRMSGSATSVGSGYFLITGCNSSGVKVFNSAGGASSATAQGHRFYTLGGYYNSSSTISSISIYSSTGNFDAGTVYVYTSA